MVGAVFRSDLLTQFSDCPKGGAKIARAVLQEIGDQDPEEQELTVGLDKLTREILCDYLQYY
jgi:hypothetical protein